MAHSFFKSIPEMKVDLAAAEKVEAAFIAQYLELDLVKGKMRQRDYDTLLENCHESARKCNKLRDYIKFWEDKIQEGKEIISTLSERADQALTSYLRLKKTFDAMIERIRLTNQPMPNVTENLMRHFAAGPPEPLYESTMRLKQSIDNHLITARNALNEGHCENARGAIGRAEHNLERFNKCLKTLKADRVAWLEDLHALDAAERRDQECEDEKHVTSFMCGCQ